MFLIGRYFFHIFLSILQYFRKKNVFASTNCLHFCNTVVRVKIHEQSGYKQDLQIQLMNSDSPYCVTTNSGRLELTKGAYLTLMKRKSSICKTLQKSKLINQSYKQNKKTIKKSYSDWKEKMHSLNNQMVLMTGKKNGEDITKSFSVKYDREVFNFPPMIPNVPMIEIECDNDCDSEWPQIEECVDNMRMSLSLAAFDHGANMATFI